MKIALITSEYSGKSEWSGGIGTYMRHLAEQLAKDNHEVYVLVLGSAKNRRYTEGGIYFEEVRIMIPNYFNAEWLDDRLPMKELWFCWKSFWAIGGFMKSKSIDVIESTSWKAPCFFYLLKKKRPKVVTRISTLYKRIKEGQYSRLTKRWRLAFWLEKAAVVWSDYRVTHSRAHREELCREFGISQDAVRVMNLGIVSQKPLSFEQDLEKQSKNDTRVLFVGRFEKRKGTDLLLKVMPSVLKACPNVHFDLIGYDPNKRSEKAFFADEKGGFQNRVSFHGEVDDATRDEHYEKTDIFVAPSRYESFGLVFTEAMSYGKPVVGFKVGAVPEVVEDGVTGILTEPENIEGLKEGIIRLATNEKLRQEMGRQAKSRVNELFSIERMGRENTKLYQEVKESKSSPMGPLLAQLQVQVFFENLWMNMASRVWSRLYWRRYASKWKGKDKPLVLDLGGIGKNREAMLPGWGGKIKITTVNLYDEADISDDATKLEKIKDDSVDGLYTSHMIEHFWWWELPEILKNWHRKLKPGGRIEIRCPDFEWAFKNSMKKRALAKVYDDILLSEVFGGATLPWHKGYQNPGQQHKNVLWFNKLKAQLEEAGFHRVRRIYYFRKYFDFWPYDLRYPEFHEKLHVKDLVVEAHK